MRWHSRAPARVLGRLKPLGVRTSSRKIFRRKAAFAGRIFYFTIIRPIVRLLTVHNIIHINVGLYNPLNPSIKSHKYFFPFNSAVVSLVTSSLYIISQYHVVQDRRDDIPFRIYLRSSGDKFQHDDSMYKSKSSQCKTGDCSQ